MDASPHSAPLVTAATADTTALRYPPRSRC